MYLQDEASFGCVSDPSYCWCKKGTRPIVPQRRIRLHCNVFGAVEAMKGSMFYMIEGEEPVVKRKIGRPRKGEIAENMKPKIKMKGVKSNFMNEYMQNLSKLHPNDYIIMVLDNALWHKSKYIKVPENMTLVFIPPYTPEMNPIEQIWREIRTSGFANKYFKTLDEVKANLHATIASLSPETIQSITRRDWIMKCVHT